MGGAAETIRIEALDTFLGSLDDNERRKVASVSTVDDLLRQMETLRASYAKSRLVNSLNRLHPVLQWFQSYNDCVKIFLEAAPDPVVLLWGSLALVIEIASRHRRALELVVAALEEVQRHGPRFEHYTVRLAGGSYDQLKVALVTYQAELLGFCHDSISFLRRSPKKNFFISTFSPFADKIKPRIQNLKELTYWVDREAVVASDERWDRRYDALNCGVQEILQRLEPQRVLQLPTTMLLTTNSFQNLPSRHGKLCHGRDSELGQLEQRLVPGVAQDTLRAACLHGMRGVGKTHLALEFAYKHLDDFDIILWVAAESSLKLQQSFADIAHGMGLADDSVQHPAQLREIVKRWILNSSKKGLTDKYRPGTKWLMICDNVEDPTLLEDYWPQASSGSIILTTTSQTVARRFADAQGTVEMEPFSGAAGTELLLKVAAADASIADERKAAKSIADALGNLPLALDLVGNYVRGLGKSLASFWRDHPHFETDFLFNPDLARWTPAHFEESISRIWALHLTPHSVNADGNLDGKSRRLINSIAFLDKDGVPLSIFQGTTPETMLFEGPDLPGEIMDLDDLIDNPFNQMLALDGAVINLRDRALVAFNDTSKQISCHRLVRHAVLKSMSRAVRYRTFNRIVFLLNACFPTQEDGKPLHSKWAACERLASQVSALLSSYFLFKADIGHPILLCEVAARCAWYFLELGQYRTARQMACQSIEICDAAISQGSHLGYSRWFVRDMTSHLYNVLATIEREQPAYGLGVTMSEKVRDIRLRNRRISNPDDEMWIAAADGNLAVSLMASGRVGEAFDILTRLRERADMKANEDVYLRNTCLCLFILGRLDEALSAGREALDAARKKRGESSEQVAACYFDLGNIYIRTGDKIAALNALQECLGRRKTSMPLHQVTAFTLHKIGDAVAMEGDFKASIPFSEQALDILSSCECHPGSLCRTAFSLAKAHEHNENLALFEKYLQRGNAARLQIKDVATEQLGVVPGNYDIFVPVGLR